VVAHPGVEGNPRSARRLNEPCPELVACEGDVPAAVNRVRVVSVREEWRVVDRWWTEQPVRRRYFEVVLESGRNVVVFLDELGERWYRQSA
jgi:hypothetical protein